MLRVVPVRWTKNLVNLVPQLSIWAQNAFRFVQNTPYTHSAPQAIRWKLFLEDYNTKLSYIPGKVNVLADCFSRFPQMDGPLPGKNEGKGKLINFRTLGELNDEDNIFMLDTIPYSPSLLLTICSNDDVDINELFMNLSIGTNRNKLSHDGE